MCLGENRKVIKLMYDKAYKWPPDNSQCKSSILIRKLQIFWRKTSFILHLKHKKGDLILKWHLKSISLALLWNLIPLILQDLNGFCYGTYKYNVGVRTIIWRKYKIFLCLAAVPLTLKFWLLYMSVGNSGSKIKQCFHTNKECYFFPHCVKHFL